MHWYKLKLFRAIVLTHKQTHLQEKGFKLEHSGHTQLKPVQLAGCRRSLFGIHSMVLMPLLTDSVVALN